MRVPRLRGSEPGYRCQFVNWSGDVANPYSASTTVTMDEDQTVTANFEVINGWQTSLKDVRHTWDDGGNLIQREDTVASENETFSYDFLDRLTSVSGAYSENFTYSEIGNILSKNGVSYSYNGTAPHAVNSVGATGYSYDANGNMTVRDSDNITWDAENRPVTVAYNGTTSTFVYDGDGNRVKKTENGETILYVNKYYEKNLTTGEETSYYYLGNRLVAKRSNSTLNYIHQDHLTGTALVTSDNGTVLGSTKYYPYGECRNSQGNLGTDRLFTGQRLDDTGLYYYGARYYDASIGRFISADPIVSSPANPQSFNRYSYCLNNPLRYIDPTGFDETTYGWTTVDGRRYEITEDAGIYRIRDREEGSCSAPISGLHSLLDSISGQMQLNDEWGLGGEQGIGPVVEIDVQTDLMDEPIPTYYAPEGSNPAKSLENFFLGPQWGMTLADDDLAKLWGPGPEKGAYIRYQKYDTDEKLYHVTMHEAYHYAEQVDMGPDAWLYGYYVPEYVGLLMLYHDTDKAHDMLSAEIAAENYARQHSGR